MRCDEKTMRLYAVTDRAWVGEKTLYEQVEEALIGGATCIQLREKEMPDEEFLAEAIEIRGLCNKYKIPFIVNDNVDVALKSGADGIHVGQSDMEAGRVRELVGEDMIIGVSAQTAEQAILAEKKGADYLGVGTVFATSTKPDADFVPREELIRICRAVKIPVCAIGGIYEHNIMELKGTGVDGVALVSAVFASRDITAECRKLLKLSEEMVKL